MTAPHDRSDPVLALVAAAATSALPLPPGASAMVRRLAARPGVAAILFYGNLRREAGAGGLLDLYVLTDGPGAEGGLSRALGRLLPPNVYHEPGADPASAAPDTSHRGGAGLDRAGPGEAGPDGACSDGAGPHGAGLAAKVAVMGLAAFAARMRPGGLDTTLWARFAQPATLLHARDAAAEDAVLAALADAARTAAWWAARLAPEGAGPDAAWAALFRATYGAELRVEGGARRAETIVAAQPDHYGALHALLIAPERPSAAERHAAARAWARRRIAGKALNLARLLKAAVTFRGGIAYALAKVERHSGAPVPLRAWERRWPWAAAPIVLIRLIRQRRLR